MRRGVKLGLILSFIILLYGLFNFQNSSSVKARESEEDTEISGDTLENYMDALDFEEIQELLEETDAHSFDIREYVEGIFMGKETFSFGEFGKNIVTIVKEEIGQQKTIFFRLLALALIAGIFSNFSSLFKNNQIGETSFYVVYLIMFSVLTVSYFSAAQLMERTFEQLSAFMKMLLPAYFAAMTFVTGVTASMGLYELTLMMISVVELVIETVVIPMIHIYFILSLANRISKEDMLSKFTETIETVIRWGLKAMLGIVVGMSTIQSMVLPAASGLKHKAVTKTMGALPVLGDLLGSVTESVIGAGVLIKNAVGAAGLVALVAICAVPVMKVVIYNLIYRLATAAAQPVSDRRMLDCLEGAVKASELLIYAGCMGILLFLFTIVILTTFTGTSVVS